MTEPIVYENFDLVIKRKSEDQYQVQVLDSPGGNATAEFTAPFSAIELENFLLKMGRPRRGTRRVASPIMDAMQGFGRRLFDAVFVGEVADCLRRSLSEVDAHDSRLRLRLRLKQAGKLAEYPWEFLYDPAGRCFLALSERTPLVRFIDLPQRIRPLAVTPPLHVLVMISSPSDYDRLDVAREWKELREALADLEREGLVKLDLLEDATLGALQSRLRKGAYHVLHFVGHGGFDERADDGILVFEDNAGRGRVVHTLELGALLRDERSLRLVVINACEGARGSAGDPFAGVAQSLIQQGVPAVIAMQFEVSDEAALAFSREFYRAVADNYPVDAALAESRKAVFSQVNEVEWGTAVLYMRSPDGCIFEVERPSGEERPWPRDAAPAAEAGAAGARGEQKLAAAIETVAAPPRPKPTETAEPERPREEPGKPESGRSSRRPRVSLSLAMGGCLGTLTVMGVVFAALIQAGAGNEEPKVAAAPPPAGSVEEESGSADLVALHREELIATIRRADAAEVRAMSTHDREALAGVYTGRALVEQRAAVDTLIAFGIFANALLEGQEFQSFWVSSDGTRARVRLTETWTTGYLRRSPQSCWASEHVRMPQTISFERRGGRWLISAIEHQSEEPEPRQVPCP